MENDDDLFRKEMLLPAIIQEWDTGKVLMLGYMNREAMEKTRSTGKVTFYSRSRNKIWVKGETSGNGLDVVEIRVDCDRDTILVLAKPEGPTCHTGSRSCFDGPPGEPAPSSPAGLPPFEIWEELLSTIRERKGGDPSVSYTASLLSGEPSLVLKKVMEEAFEVSVSTLAESRDRQLSEWADLFFHAAVALEKAGLSWPEVMEVLESRKSRGGFAEKKSRKT
ncbi:MAG: bifunctional phosphoribosyl-AMP cyclohydrolase/phosphoribosyl-ATP diphosphatase HisIE [Leptospirillum sp.]